MGVIQVIDRTSKYVSDVIPTQAKRIAYVASRLAKWSDNNLILANKLSNRKTNTPSGKGY